MRALQQVANFSTFLDLIFQRIVGVAVFIIGVMSHGNPPDNTGENIECVFHLFREYYLQFNNIILTVQFVFHWYFQEESFL